MGTTLFAEVANLNSDWEFRRDCDNVWQRVSVPHCVNAHDTFDGHAGAWGEKDQWRGTMFYRKKLAVSSLQFAVGSPQTDDSHDNPQTANSKLQTPNSKNKYFLEIEAIRQTARVRVNGKEVGFYDAGVAPCGFDLTDALKEGENEIEIETDSRTASDGGADYQWNEASFNPVQGGLTGNVKLHIKPAKAYFTLPLYSTLGTVGTYIWADEFDLENGSATVHVNAEVAGDAQHKIRFAVNGQVFDGNNGRVTGIKFWSPDTPQLYDVKVDLVGEDGETIDSETIRTGFRKIEYDFAQGGLFINGKNFTLPGYSQRSVDCWAAIGLPTDWMMDWEMKLVRESNANHIRWMHVAAKPNAVRSCDKMGVVETCPAGDKESESKGKHWEQRVAAMRDVIIYFRNSPSIFFWEAGNNQISPEHMREMRLLKEKYDSHNGRFMGCRTLQTPEQIAEAEYVGTMINRMDAGAFASMKALGKYMPIMETEFCREEAPRRIWDDFTPPDFDYVNRWLGRGNRENGFDAHDKTQEDIARSNASDAGWSYFWGNRVNGKAAKYYTGWAMLCWSDMIELGRNSASENSRVSGRVDAVRIPKENYYVLKTLQSEIPAAKILGHWSYPPFTDGNYWYHGRRDTGHHWEWTDEKLRRDPMHKTVYVIGSKHVASMELLVNGKSKGIVTETSGGPFTYAFENIDVTESGSVEAIARDAQGNEIARDRIETVGAPAKIAATVTTGPEGWLADGSDITFIDLALVDAEGRLLPYANDKIVCSLEFAACSSPGVDSQAPSRPTFMGGFNSGTFRDDEKNPSPVGENFVRFECGVARVFVKAGFDAGKATLKVKCENGMETEVALKLRMRDAGMENAPPQEYEPNKYDFTVTPTSPQVREYKPKHDPKMAYTILVGNTQVDFHRHGAKPVKPDANTGVVAPYGPVLRALESQGAGIKLEYVQNPTKAHKLPAYLRAFKPPYLKVTTADGHTIECVKGETVIYYDAGAEKNLTNCEMTEDGRHELVGELVALLQYLKNVKVTVDDTLRLVTIEVMRNEE